MFYGIASFFSFLFAFFKIWFSRARVWLGKNRLCGSAENFMWLVKHHQSQSLSHYHHSWEERILLISTRKSKIQMMQETIKTNKASALILRFIRRLRRMRKEVQSKRNLSWVDKSSGATHWWLLKQFKDFKEVFVCDGPAFSTFSHSINVSGFSFLHKMFLQNSLLSGLALCFISRYRLFANFHQLLHCVSKWDFQEHIFVRFQFSSLPSTINDSQQPLLYFFNCPKQLT